MDSLAADFLEFTGLLCGCGPGTDNRNFSLLFVGGRDELGSFTHTSHSERGNGPLLSTWPAEAETH